MSVDHPPGQGGGWVSLDWKGPVDGGKVAAYKIEGRERVSGPWTDVGMPIEHEITLSGQERGKEWEYRVIAVNEACLCGYAHRQAAEGAPSNSVMAVL